VTEPATEAATEAPTEAATEAPTEAATEAPTEAATEAPTGVPVTGAATVNVGESAEYGTILVNGEGLSLYVTSNDTPDSGTSSCMDACTVEWPPLLTDGDPVAGEGVDASLLGAITRDDGTTQVTYNGMPLHTFDEDTAAGDTNGQGVDDEFGHWTLVSPAGEMIQ
jgi:predicted lipoprotein with Yx(FWY)xxD motif